MRCSDLKKTNSYYYESFGKNTDCGLISYRDVFV